MCGVLKYAVVTKEGLRKSKPTDEINYGRKPIKRISTDRYTTRNNNQIRKSN